MSNLLQVPGHISVGRSPHGTPSSRHHDFPLGSDAASMFSKYSDDSAFPHSNIVPSTRATTPQLPCLPTINLHEDVSLVLDAGGRAIFDHQRQDGAHITPRQVTDLHWYTEQSDNMHEYIVLKVRDQRNHEEVWTRFCAYSGGGVRGDVAYSQAAIVPRGSSRHASLEFVNGIEYRDVLEIMEKMNRLYRASEDPAIRAPRTAAFIGMLSLRIGKGVGQCSPQDLCEIWPSVPDTDRRLHGFQWYEVADGSGTEYLVLHIAGTADFTTSESDNWWVRLERTEMVDQATFSANQELVVHAGSELKHSMRFDAGIPFDRVIDVLQKVPTGFNFIIEDCWFYTSTIAHKLSMEVSDDLCECRIEDLCEIWSGERGAQMLVNRIQCFQPDAGSPPDYLLLNVSPTKQDLRGVWVRLGQVAAIGREENWAAISRNRRRLMEVDIGSPLSGGSIMLVDIAFESLKYGQVTAELKKLNPAMTAQNPVHGSYTVQPVETIKRITELPNMFYCCVNGDVKDLLDGFAY